MDPISRRTFVRSAALAATLTPLTHPIARALAKAEPLRMGPATPFSFEALCSRAQKLAANPYKPPYRPAPEIVSRIDYEAHGKIHWKIEDALFGDGSGAYPVTFFHLGQFFQKSVKMHAVQGGQAREILYSPKYFEMPANSIARKLPADSGFAGFRLQESPRRRSDWKTQDWLAFLGASYFRSIGSLGQYGLSARGIAVNTTASTPEEFPDFTEFYLQESRNPADPVWVYALLDGPSLAGAYRFACRRGSGVVMEIDNALFLRRDIEQLGIAPLTSMFWYAEYLRGPREDWRPEVHDSDGLALWRGNGERVYRPLNDPPHVITSSFIDEHPKGFGLLQRDRNYEHYLDGVNYDKRPSLWVEALSDFGKGAVQLVEIPTDDEIHDNIVAFWVPKAPAKAGNELRYKYRLFWQADEPYMPANLARVAATRMGRGGEPGKPRPAGVTKFVVEFEGGSLRALSAKDKLKAEITASRGKIRSLFVEPVGATKRWRAQFDLTPEGTDPIELRLYLRKGKQTLTETWLYQFLSR